MKKVLSLMIVMVLVSGCALMGPSPENPRLLDASQSANEAIQKARDVGAQDTHSDDISLIEQQLNKLDQRRSQSPSMEMVDEYHRVERAAYETAINSLQQKLENERSRFDDLQSKVDDLRSKLENRVSSLESRVKSLEKQKNQLRKEKKEYQVQVGDLQEQKNRLQTQNNELRSQINELNKQKNALQEELDRVRKDRNRLEVKLEDRGATIARLRKALRNKSGEVQNLKTENRSIKGELDQKLDEGDVRTKDRKVYIALKSKLLFGLGNVHVQDDIKDDLKKIASTLKNYPERKILVEGHTDDLPLQNELKEKYGSNWELSGQRAINVLKYLVYGQNVDAKRIGAVAYGKFRPRVPNNSDANRQKNRRVEIVLLPPELSVKTKSLTE